MNQNPKCKGESYYSEKNIGEYFHALVFVKGFIGMTTKAQGNRRKTQIRLNKNLKHVWFKEYHQESKKTTHKYLQVMYLIRYFICYIKNLLFSC